MDMTRRLRCLLLRWRRTRARRRIAKAGPDPADLGTGWGMEQRLSAFPEQPDRR